MTHQKRPHFTDLADTFICGDIQFREQGQTVPGRLRVKGFAQRPNSEITLPTTGFEPSTFWSRVWCPDPLKPHSSSGRTPRGLNNSLVNNERDKQSSLGKGWIIHDPGNSHTLIGAVIGIMNNAKIWKAYFNRIWQQLWGEVTVGNKMLLNIQHQVLLIATLLVFFSKQSDIKTLNAFLKSRT